MSLASVRPTNSHSSLQNASVLDCRPTVTSLLAVFYWLPLVKGCLVGHTTGRGVMNQLALHSNKIHYTIDGQKLASAAQHIPKAK